MRSRLRSQLLASPRPSSTNNSYGRVRASETRLVQSSTKLPTSTSPPSLAHNANGDLDVVRKSSRRQEADFLRTFLIHAGRSLGIKDGDYSAWYRIKSSDVIKKGGGGMLHRHNNSLAALVKGAFPEHPWDDGKFSKSPQRYWADLENRKKLIRDLQIELKLKDGDFEAWYQVTPQRISSILDPKLKRRVGSLPNTLAQLFPEHPWDMSKFQVKPESFWKSDLNQRQFLEELGRKLGYKEGDMEPWYKVSVAEIRKHGGDSLIKMHKGSIMSIVANVFPSYDWILWKFTNSRNPAKLNPTVLLRAANVLEAKFELKQKSDWTRVTVDNLKEVGLFRLVRSLGGLVEFLRRAYPEHPWREEDFPRRGGRKASKP